MEHSLLKLRYMDIPVVNDFLKIIMHKLTSNVKFNDK